MTRTPRSRLTAATATTLAGLAMFSGCSVTVTDPATQPSAEQSATTSTSVPVPTGSSATASATPDPTSSTQVPTDALVPGYPAGQFATVALFDLPDITRLNTAGKKLRDKLVVKLPKLDGITIGAVQCGKNGSYVNVGSGLVLYGDGTGTYSGPDGSHTRYPDGSEVSASDREQVTRDGKGGGVYTNGKVAITNNGDGSGSYSDDKVSITVDGRGGGSYTDGVTSITVGGDGSGTSTTDTTSITVDGDGSGSYTDGTLSITNDGKGEAVISSPSFSGVVPALGKFPPVVAMLPKKNPCGFVITLSDGVLFDFDKSDIRADAAGTLDDLASALRQVGGRDVQISGHTDAIGTDAYNQQLSERRAASVEQALLQRGVTAPMTAKGYGETRPVAPNRLDGKDNPAGRQLNRRVEIFVRA